MTAATSIESLAPLREIVRTLFHLSFVVVLVALPQAGGGPDWIGSASAEPARIGILHPGSSRPAEPSRVTVLRITLRELGYVEGRDFSIEARYADGQPDLLPGLAADLVRKRVDVIVASGFAIAAAQQATTAIPIVMNFSGDPVGLGYVQSLARPGGNVTGIATLAPETSAKRLEVLRELVPTADRIGYVTGLPNSLEQRGAESAAQRLRVAFVVIVASDPASVDSALHTLRRDNAKAVMFSSDPVLARLTPRLVELAAKHRLPASYEFREQAEVGGLISYGPDTVDLGRRAASFVDRILKGAKPADLPVEQPTKFELVINGTTAKALGLSIPASLLVRADKVIW